MSKSRMVEAASLTLGVDRQDVETLSRQIYLQLRDLILSGRLGESGRLPSTRQLAVQLNVSRTVCIEACEQLVAEGYAEARRGSGLYVREVGVAGLPRPVAAGDEGCRVDIATPKVFNPLAHDPSLFPHRLWSRLLARGWRDQEEPGWELRDWRGYAPLRQAIAAHLRAFRGVAVSPDQIIVTAGMGDAIAIICRSLAMEGEPQAWVEEPGHLGARQALAREGFEILRIPVDDEGLDVAAGRSMAPEASIVHITSQRQYPLGCEMSLSRRLSLLQWAHGASALILEDDYDSEMRFAGKPAPSLYGLDRGRSVLLLGSMSKLTYPGLRLGYIVAPAAMADRIAHYRRAEGTPVAATSQPALAELIASGAFARHLRQLQRHLRERRTILLEGVSARLSDYLATLPQRAGSDIAVLLKGEMARLGDRAIAARAGEFEIDLAPLSIQASSERTLQGFILGFAGWSEGELKSGLERLLDLFRSLPAATRPGSGRAGLP